MASARWKESGTRARARESGAIPDLVRRALSAGFSGIFMTGEALRDAIGDSLPREWADFAADQSARTRSEFIERMTAEMGRAIEKTDWAAVLAALLEGRTLEVTAQIRLGENDGTRAISPGSVRVKLDED
ncbi:MAG TPA: hypothetical protein VKH41_01280 [Myxococcota bacterium]|nr:hypothetical protein [Myxococcota bacterium]